MSAEVYLEKKNGWAVITIDRPKQMNALNTDIVEKIDGLLDQVEDDPEIRCLMFTGAGEKSFIAGADIGMMGAPCYQPKDAHYLITCGYKVYNRIEWLKIPTIACINGYCLGGGLELAMCCDFRIASKNARFALPEIALGIIPGWGGTIRLPRIIGEGRAKDMILRAKRIHAETALQYGLVTEVYEDVPALRAGAEALAVELASKAPITMQMDKELINRSTFTHNDVTDSLALSYCFTTQDSREGIAAFLEKRTPEFHGC
ncbi:enoyl-CoA hydratase/isomerase family protein [Lawsonibacter sp. LCP25S3_G6]|uniref:enoyl-CoA hydratase/isomerase family protein n=1 Tax=unclassified Lawsonibacter TaxID=2617946 RepID=UPI003F97A8EA